jgi:glycerol-3-phosphate acyltransferase PlsY
MPITLELCLVIVAAYLVGGIPFGYVIGRLKGIDIREHGSGNIGATNVLRTLGKAWGLSCFALDFAKGLLPVLLSRAFQVSGASATTQTMSDLLPLLVVVATVAGHIWTPYLRFKGGKGIATSAGAITAIAPLPVLCALLVWAIALGFFRMVGLASVCAAAALPLAAVLLSALQVGAPTDTPVLVLLIVIGVLAIIRHRANIQRILKGTEPKIGQKKASHENSSPQ